MTGAEELVTEEMEGKISKKPGNNAFTDGVRVIAEKGC